MAGRADPGPGSWGSGKDWRVWDGAAVADVVETNVAVQRRLLEVLDAAAATGVGGRRPELDQLARDALLTLASDWAFMVSHDSAVQYARSTDRRPPRAVRGARRGDHGWEPGGRRTAGGSAAHHRRAVRAPRRTADGAPRRRIASGGHAHPHPVLGVPTARLRRAGSARACAGRGAGRGGARGRRGHAGDRGRSRRLGGQRRPGRARRAGPAGAADDRPAGVGHVLRARPDPRGSPGRRRAEARRRARARLARRAHRDCGQGALRHPAGRHGPCHRGGATPGLAAGTAQQGRAHGRVVADLRGSPGHHLLVAHAVGGDPALRPAAGLRRRDPQRHRPRALGRRRGRGGRDPRDVRLGRPAPRLHRTAGVGEGLPHLARRAAAAAPTAPGTAPGRRR